MTRILHSMVAAFLLAPVAFGANPPEPRPHLSQGDDIITGGLVGAAKAVVDTVLLMGPTGSGAPYIGDFESEWLDGGWAGWTGVDYTQPTTTHFNLNTVNNDIPGIDGTSAWCGEFIAACSADDSAWGFGNNWVDLLEFRKAVADPSISTTLTLTGNLFHDSEPGYDYTEFGQLIFGTFYLVNVGPSYDGAGSELLNASFTWQPGEYLNGNEVALQVRFRSDGGWSDGDCSYQSRGACNLDNLTMTAAGGLVGVFTDDFEAGWGNWAQAYPNGVGDFSKIWSNLQDMDPCGTNVSHQVAFIDDGGVVPGTGGTRCINWCYGPGGFIVNCNGGMAGPAASLNNAIESPVMALPEGAGDGIHVAWDVFVHEDLSDDSPGIFYMWGVRSADTDNSAGNGAQVIADQPWLDRNFIYYGGPIYRRDNQDVTDLMNPGCDQVQVQLAAYQYPYWWFWSGNDGYPAPYFDNVSVRVFPQQGPSLSGREIDQAQDNFSESGTIDPTDLGALSVRFDMARDISLPSHLRNDPGDSILVNVAVVRGAAVLAGEPTLHWTRKPNPLFDPYRTSPLGIALDGETPGTQVPEDYSAYDIWAFDLPDTGFLFPGDVLHYCITAADEADGDVRTAILPADTTGFSDFGDPLAYDPIFAVRALPTLAADGQGGVTQPSILLWDDAGSAGGRLAWHGALANLGLCDGMQYDTYTTKGPSSGVGNGLGGRATLDQIAGYTELLYTSGDMVTSTISNGDFSNDAGDDVGLLTAWLDMGGRDLFMTGDNLAADLVQAGTATVTFLMESLGLTAVNTNIRPLIDEQQSPLVQALPGNPVLSSLDRWLAYGSCPVMNQFDAVTPIAPAVALAEFTDPTGAGGAYPYSAATLNVTAAGSRCLSLPYDFGTIRQPDKTPAPLAARVQVLGDVLGYFEIPVAPGASGGIPVALEFTASHHPNPFNPVTEITFTLPLAGQVTINIFNVRGELVTTLLDEPRAAGPGTIMWDGTDRRGAAVASGIYFYEVRSGGEVKIGKMALIK